MVDCGLHQGSGVREESNWAEFSYDVTKIDALFITHPHIDHIGRVPLLLKRGFKGKIYSTPPARDAAHELLLDSEHLLFGVADRAGVEPLYGPEDVEHAMDVWEGVEYHSPITVGDCTVTLYNAGHVLGSSSILVVGADGKRILFSGDLGNSPAPLLGGKDMMPDADYCLIESAYGNRIHEDRAERQELLENAIEDTVKNGGVLMIPTFALERTQELLSELDDLIESGRIPSVPVYMDSPLAIRLTEIYKKYPAYLKAGTFDFTFKGLHITSTTEQSKAINTVPAPKIVIAGSGMSNGGRILHHEKNYLPDPKSMFLAIGYQAEGTLGRRILDGEKTVRIFSEDVPVHCKVRAIGGYSAHADQKQLLEWISTGRDTLKRVFVVQGEGEASLALAQKMRDEFALNAIVPEAGKTYEL
jgi:metallo-beta-lactamase family protein